MNTFFLTILLQSGPIIDAVGSRLTDQLFSIVLLVAFAWISIKRQKQMQDKIDKYLEEDRAKMMEVINQNTAAFEDCTRMMADIIAKQRA